jgi:hypothetical protein
LQYHFEISTLVDNEKIVLLPFDANVVVGAIVITVVFDIGSHVV